MTDAYEQAKAHALAALARRKRWRNVDWRAIAEIESLEVCGDMSGFKVLRRGAIPPGRGRVRKGNEGSPML